MKSSLLFKSVLSCAVAALAITPALAWDGTGHQIIGIIAYNDLTPKEQARLNQILNAGDPGFRVPQDKPALGLGKAATFPDYIKGNTETIYEKLINDLNDRFYPIEKRRPRDNESTRLRAWDYKDKVIHAEGRENHVHENPVDAVKAIEFSRKSFTTASSDQDRCFYVYMLSHIVGDLGQPLHCVSSVMFSPEGDAGGNGFTLKIGSVRNLHFLWDSAITDATRSWPGDLIDKSKRIAEMHPRSEFTNRLKDKNPDHWVDEGADFAVSTVYKGIERDATSEPAEYQKKRFELALKQAAISGYRVADELRALLK